MYRVYYLDTGRTVLNNWWMRWWRMATHFRI